MLEIAFQIKEFLIQSRLFNDGFFQFLIVITNYKLCSCNIFKKSHFWNHSKFYNIGVIFKESNSSSFPSIDNCTVENF